MQTRAPKPMWPLTPSPLVQPLDQGQMWTQCQAGPALPVKDVPHMAVATFGHTFGDLAHWEVGVSRGLEVRKWGELPERHMVRPTPLSALHCLGRLGTKGLVTCLHTTEDRAMAWNKCTCAVSSGSTETQGRLALQRIEAPPVPCLTACPWQRSRGCGWSMPSPRHIFLSESRAITPPLLRRPANPLYRVHTGDTASSDNQILGSSRACGLHQAEDPLTTHT